MAHGAIDSACRDRTTVNMKQNPTISLAMGSSSDWETLRHAAGSASRAEVIAKLNDVKSFLIQLKQNI